MRSTLQAQKETLIDAHEVARMLRLHPVTVREMASRGEIPAMRIGRVWRFRPSTLDAWIDCQLQWDRHSQSPKEQK